jgi:probable F420-dependent oxidoreductase
MKFGFTVPTRGPLATRESIKAIMEKGEALGFAYATVNDHIVVPKDVASRYPYSEGGDWAGGRFGEALEQVSMLTFLAGVSETLRLVTAVMVVPYRNPVLVARMLATADVLSNGRITVGCGVGWMREEFEAVGAPPFDERGRVADEYLRVFKEVWCNGEPSYDGEYARFDNVSALPLPVQDPHPPIWIGGESGPALRRTASLGDGWFPIGSNPRHPLDTRERYAAALARLRQVAEKCGRDPSEIDLAYSANWTYGADAMTADTGDRHAFTGTAAELLDDIDAFGTMGVRHLMLNFQSRSFERTIARMEAFADEVIAKVD